MRDSEQKDILESWKEIADYLDRNVKTCHRWEVELELPIRRLDGTPKARVFAYKHELDAWLEKKLSSQNASTTHLKRTHRKKSRIIWIAISAALTLIILLALAAVFIPRIDFLFPPPIKPHLAVLPIKNYTGDQSLSHLQDTLTTLIVSDLYQSKYIRVLTLERLNEILANLDKLQVDSLSTADLKMIASMEGVTHFLSGSVTKSGDTIRLDISIQDADGWEVLWSDRMEAAPVDIFAMVDLLTTKLKPHLNLTDRQIADDFDKAIANVTTPNEQALHFYIEARKAMNATEWHLAIDIFKRAIALDPDFAMAYRHLSGAYNYLALATREDMYWEKLREYALKSREAAQRRPPSERERLIIEGLSIFPSDVAKEMEIFKDLLEKYPDDDYGNYRLGTRYFHGEAYDRAEKYLKRIAASTNNAITYYNLSKIYLDQARYTEAEALLQLALRRFPYNSLIFQRMAQLYTIQLKFPEALLWCDRGFEVEPIQFRDSLVRGDILFFMGEFAEAEKEYRLCLNSENNQTRIMAATSLMQLYKTQGRYSDAWQQAEQTKLSLSKNVSWDFDPINIELARLNARNGNIQEALTLCDKVMGEPRQLKMRGEIYVRAEQWPDVEDLLAELERTIHKNDQHEWQMYLARNDMEGPYRKRLRDAVYTINARAALQKGAYVQAIANLDQSKTVYPGMNLIPADLVENLARAYYESGDLKSAGEQWEWITRMTYSRKAFGGIYARSFFMLGKIFDDQGDQSKALKNYETFLDLWQDADPGLPELEIAEHTVRALRSQ